MIELRPADFGVDFEIHRFAHVDLGLERSVGRHLDHRLYTAAPGRRRRQAHLSVLALIGGPGRFSALLDPRHEVL